MVQIPKCWHYCGRRGYQVPNCCTQPQHWKPVPYCCCTTLAGKLSSNNILFFIDVWIKETSVLDPFHFDTDPDPRIRFVHPDLKILYFLQKYIYFLNWRQKILIDRESITLLDYVISFDFFLAFCDITCISLKFLYLYISLFFIYIS